MSVGVHVFVFPTHSRRTQGLRTRPLLCHVSL